MQKSAKNPAGKKSKTKSLGLLLVLAVILLGVYMLRNAWSQMHFFQNEAKQDMASLQQKVEMLHENMHAIRMTQPVDENAYTIAQLKNAYLLTRTAAISLERDHDVTVAKQLLQLAYEHLAHLQGAKVDKARAIIAADQERLNAVSFSDIGVVQDKLEVLDKLVNILPAHKNHAQDITPANDQSKTAKAKHAQPTWYESLWNSVADAKTIVKVKKKADRAVNVAEIDVARAQFRLTLEQLRWAAYYNNNEVFQRSIANAQRLLPEMFDMSSESVQKFSSTLDELQKINLRPEVPDLQNSVNALQALLVG